MRFYLSSTQDWEPYDDLNTNKLMKGYCQTIERETDAYEDLAQVLTPAKGKILTMTIKESPNKKNPDRPYRNYEFDKAEQPKPLKLDDKEDPFKGNTGSGIELTDDDLPFGK